VATVSCDPIRSLDREWEQFARGRLRQRLGVWAGSEPALARFTDAQGLIRFLRGGASAADKDLLLRALVATAREDLLAARVVLEAVMPGLKRLVERATFDERDREELWALVLAHAWQQIRGYPLERRPAKIAANLILETRRQALAEFRRERQRRHDEPPTPADHVPLPPPSRSVDDVLGSAVRAGAISGVEAELILRTRIDGLTVVEAAAELGLPYMRVYMRRQRAERRLLLFLGHTAPPVKNRPSEAHCLVARVAGGGRAGSAGGGAALPT
jgi:DNA-directed RNA polymerase specialized sigma24 family protein